MKKHLIFQKYATVQKDGKQGFINTSGKVVVLQGLCLQQWQSHSSPKRKKGKTDAYGKVEWGLKIGSFYKGGVVIELDKSGKHGIICAVRDCGWEKKCDFCQK